MISKFCNVIFLHFKSIIVVDKGTTCSALKFHELGEEKLKYVYGSTTLRSCNSSVTYFLAPVIRSLGEEKICRDGHS